MIFMLAGEEYGLEILKVQEIRGNAQLTRIPNAPAHLLGALNLRGIIIPVVDLRKRFDLPKAERTRNTVVIVLSVTDSIGRRVMGIVVDGVSGVIDVNAADIRAAPDLGGVVHAEFIMGMTLTGGRTVILLDSDRMLADDVPAALQGAQH